MESRKANKGAVLYISLLILSVLSAITIVALQRSILQTRMISNMNNGIELDAMVLNVINELNNNISPSSDFQRIESSSESTNTDFQAVDIALPVAINEKYSTYFKNIKTQGMYKLEASPYYLKNKSGCSDACFTAYLVIKVDALSTDEHRGQQYLGLRLLHPQL